MVATLNIKIKKPPIKELLKEEVVETTAESHWTALGNAIEEAIAIIPEKEKKNKKTWMTEEILALMEERRRYKNIDEEKYRELDRKIHRECTKAKEKWMDEICTEIEELDKRDQQRMYEKVSSITKKKKGTQNNTIKKRDGTLAMELDEVKER